MVRISLVNIRLLPPALRQQQVTGVATISAFSVLHDSWFFESPPAGGDNISRFAVLFFSRARPD
nr:hypothetical protein [Escherichia coli]